MNAEHDRDHVLDQVLKQALGAGQGAPATAACLDAETLAAWMDGGLDATSVAMAEAHASSCARCQALIGTMARTTPDVTAIREGRASLWRWWLAPLAAAAAATTVWIVMPPRQRAEPPAAPEAKLAQTSPSAEADVPAAPAAIPPAPLSARARDTSKDDADAAKLSKNAPDTNRVEDTARFREARRAKAEETIAAETGADAVRQRVAPAEARDAQAPAMAAAPPISQLRRQAPAREIASPDPAIRWRLGASGVTEYTVNNGAAWEQLSTGVTTEITSGSSPSATVCWLVGRGGMVMLTTNGRTFTRVPFPETIDLVSIQAADARTATVTASDGRSFRTDDSGLNWRRQ